MPPLWNPKNTEFVFSSFKSFEDRLFNILAIMPYDETNKGSWSPELVSLFLDICGTIDSVTRHIVAGGENNIEKEVEIKDENNQNIRKKLKFINVSDFEFNLWKELRLQEAWVVLYIYSLFPNCAIMPFKDYRESNDGWWSIYNFLKHNRLDHYEKANLENTIKALSALFLILVRYMDEEFTKALIRNQWISTSIVPEFVHPERTSSTAMPMWLDSKLFGTNSVIENISSGDVTTIQAYLGSKKFHEFIGRYNSIQ
jgi:hypothetical protein